MSRKMNNIDTKRMNKIKIAKFIYSNNETSKQEIAQVLGLSMPTVLQNVKELVDYGIVNEVGEYQSTGGRKAKALSIAGNIKYAIGLDITRNHISFVLVDLRGNILAKERLKNTYEDSMDYYETLGSSLENFIQNNDIERSKILGVGISIPGIIDKDNLVLMRSHILEVSNISLKKFSRFIPYDTCFRNDANSAAYAELRTDVKDMIYLSLSNTVGGAICMNGEIYMGNNYKSAEFGHMIIEPNGRQCYCGKKGCIDAYCSAKVLTKYSNDDLELFFEKLGNGNEVCIPVWKEYLNYLAIAITNLRMAFDCDIILGGYIGGYLDNYLLELDKNITKYNNFEMDMSYIRTAVYKREASAIGAGIQFVEKFFDFLL